MPHLAFVQGVPFAWYLILSAILFGLGVLGFLLRRNIITVFMSIELMLNAVNLSSWSWRRRKLPSGWPSFLLSSRTARHSKSTK